jgi:hypothetical protein
VNILLKINSKSLNLKGYKVNIGIYKALRDAMHTFPDLIDSMILENNGMKDEVDQTGFIENPLSILLEGAL